MAIGAPRGFPILPSNPCDWPEDFQEAYRQSLVARQYAEMRYLLLLGIAVSLGSIPLDLLIIPDRAWITVLLRLVVVLPFQIAALMMPMRMLGWQKLAGCMAPFGLSAIALIGSQWTDTTTAAVLAVAPLMLLGVSAPILPFSPRESNWFVAGFAALLICSFLILDTPALRDPAYIVMVLLTMMVSIALPRRLWVLQANNFLLSMQASQQLESLTEHNAYLKQLTRLDPLTGLANRRHAREVFVDQFQAPRAVDEATVAVLMLDIDRFKGFNDKWGHEAGDACLRAVAKELRHVASSHDGLAARFGGEEFVIILRAMHEKQALEAAEALRISIERIEVPVGQRGKMARLTASIGIALHEGEDMPDLSALLRAADQALYNAKRAGRNRCEMAVKVVNAPA